MAFRIFQSVEKITVGIFKANLNFEIGFFLYEPPILENVGMSDVAILENFWDYNDEDFSL